MRLLSHLLARFVDVGHLEVEDPSGRTHSFGGKKPGPYVALKLHDPKLPLRIAMAPALAVGEAYMDGTLTLERGSTLQDFFALYGHNYQRFHNLGWQRVIEGLGRAAKRLHEYNPIGRAQKNVAHHYDLSGKLFDLFLDVDRQYSCAYFRDPDVSLELAQRDKKLHIAAKLLLDDAQKVLDIGCGWGGMALTLASLAPVEVVGVTLSTEQHGVATKRAAEAGLSDRVQFRLQDYRHVPEEFDRIVSVGMFEHVGAAHYDEFFRKIGELLTDDGVMLLHSIGRMDGPGTTSAWLRKYIFPGGYTPALSEVMAAIERQGLWVLDMEVLRIHYADTLKVWNERFQANRAEIAAMYDERFCRMWEFYLLACENEFRLGSAMVFQLQIGRRRDAAPLVRDYMVDTERRYRAAADAQAASPIASAASA